MSCIIKLFIMYWIVLFLILIMAIPYDQETVGPAVYFLSLILLTTIGTIISTFVTLVAIVLIISLVLMIGGVFM